jgi:hypothetical protein
MVNQYNPLALMQQQQSPDYFSMLEKIGQGALARQQRQSALDAGSSMARLGAIGPDATQEEIQGINSQFYTDMAKAQGAGAPLANLYNVMKSQRFMNDPRIAKATEMQHQAIQEGEEIARLLSQAVSQNDIEAIRDLEQRYKAVYSSWMEGNKILTAMQVPAHMKLMMDPFAQQMNRFTGYARGINENTLKILQTQGELERNPTAQELAEKAQELENVRIEEAKKREVLDTQAKKNANAISSRLAKSQSIGGLDDQAIIFNVENAVKPLAEHLSNLIDNPSNFQNYAGVARGLPFIGKSMPFNSAQDWANALVDQASKHGIAADVNMMVPRLNEDSNSRKLKKDYINSIVTQIRARGGQAPKITKKSY